MARKFTKHPSNYVKATAYYVSKTQMDDWKQIARAYARKVGAELLFVNENSFGIEYPDGTMQHIRIEDLADLLGAGDIGEVEACGSIGCSTRIQASEDEERTVQFSFDYYIPGLHNNNLKEIIRDVFAQNGCEVVGIQYYSVDYSGTEMEDEDVHQVGVAFECVDYDGHAIERQLSKELYDAGFVMIGNPEFY